MHADVVVLLLLLLYWAAFIVERLTFMMTCKKPYTEYNSKNWLAGRGRTSRYKHVILCCSHICMHAFRTPCTV